MRDAGIEDLSSLGILQAALPPPPPSSALRASVTAMRPVRTRVPFLSLLVIAVAACVFPVAALALLPLRRDLAALPSSWFGGVALTWLAGFIVPLTHAVLPRPGQVLPDAARAMRTAGLAGLTSILMGLLVTVDAPGSTILPRTTWDGFLHLWWHCVSFSFKVTVPAVLVGAFCLRKVAVARLWQLGAAVGAAAGALSGLTLHGLCPYGGGVHVGLAHGGGVVIGAVLGALWLPFLIRFGSYRPDQKN